MKTALCIHKAESGIDENATEIQGIPEDFFKKPSFLVDRDKCETNESLLQLIPYIVVYNSRGEIFTYERGSSGGEDRLHSKLSIGIGGHVEDLAASDTLWSLLPALLEGARRELKEELGVDGVPSHFMAAIYTGSTGNAVDKVHLGLLSHVTLMTDAESAEPDIVKDGRFLKLADLMLPENFDRHEVWSQLVVRRLHEQLSETFGRMLGSFGSLVHRLSVTSSTGATFFALQEIGVMLSALGHNIEQGFATAELHDAEEALDLIEGTEDYLRSICVQMGWGDQ